MYKNQLREAQWKMVNTIWGLRVVGERPAIGTPVEAKGKDGLKREVIACVPWHGIDRSGVLASFCLTGRVVKQLKERADRWDEANYYGDLTKNPWRKLTQNYPRGSK